MSAAGSPESKRRLLVSLVVFAPVLLTTVTMALLTALGLRDWRIRYHTASLTYSLYNVLVVALLLKSLPESGLTTSDIGLTKPKLREIGIGVLFYFVNVIVWIGIYALLPSLVSSLERGMVPKLEHPWEVAVQFAYAVVASPVCEEILFRGFLITLLERATGRTWLASLLSIAAFTAIHIPRWGVAGALAIAIWAVIPTLLFVWRRNLTAPIVLHMINNFYAYIVMRT